MGMAPDLYTYGSEDNVRKMKANGYNWNNQTGWYRPNSRNTIANANSVADGYSTRNGQPQRTRYEDYYRATRGKELFKTPTRF